jgi:hypothetical protein
LRGGSTISRRVPTVGETLPVRNKKPLIIQFDLETGPDLYMEVVSDVKVRHRFLLGIGACAVVIRGE